MNDLNHLRRAIELARSHSQKGEGGPFGAVVVRDCEVVGEGWNRVVEKHDPTAHAEVLAIRDAAGALDTHVLDDCTIYCSCEPCPMCLSAIYWARIPRIVFAASGEDARAAGFDDTSIASEVTQKWEARTVNAKQALAQEGREVLENWIRNPDRVEY